MMSNFVLSPRAFDLEIAIPLRDGFLNPERHGELQEIIPDLNIAAPIKPVALRWRLHPERIDMPRTPFQVWRRVQSLDVRLEDLGIPPTTIVATSTIEWERLPLFELRARIRPEPGATMSVEALDDHGETIPGEIVTGVSSENIVRLHRPNICAVRITGRGVVSEFLGLSMVAYANMAGWELIETVGLPFHLHETPVNVYDAREQGLPSDPKSGFEAAHDRLKIGEILYEPPFPTGPGGVLAPGWPAPPPNQVLAEIRDGDLKPLSLLREMFENVSPGDPARRQFTFAHQVTDLRGFHQPGGGISTDPANVDLPVASLILLSVATDTWSALVLGFGTTDFPLFRILQGPFLEPKRAFQLVYDYMVTFSLELPFGLHVDYAALAAIALPTLPAPANFHAQRHLKNRPQDRDGQASVDVELRWSRPERQNSPHGYVIGLLEGGGPPQVLNEPRLGIGFTPFIPVTIPEDVPVRNPADRLSNEVFASFVDHLRRVPFEVSRTDTYLAAALDVFSRWSEWSRIDHVVATEAPAQPRILKAQFNLNTGMVTPGSRSIPATLVAEVVWDWQDRSPREIELVGQFYDSAVGLPATVPIGIQIRQSLIGTTPAGIRFVLPPDGPLNETPTSYGLTSTSTPPVMLPPAPSDGEARRYRITIDNMRVNFATAARLTYAIYARAKEKRNDSLFSGYTEPKTVVVYDPLPAVVPTVSPVLRFAALPDANGIARFKMDLGAAIDHATGYVAYEASESALRAAAGLGPPTSTDLVARATELQVFASSLRARDLFARVSTQPFASPQFELSLPGALDGFFVYFCTTLTENQVESEPSGVIFVAVPNRITPGAPSLQVRRVRNTTPGSEPPPGFHRIHVRVEPGVGPPPAGVELYRTRSKLLSEDIDAMGPPVADQADAGWTVIFREEPDLSHIPVAFTREENVPSSWFPYFCRSVAFGEKNPGNGILPGRSLPSPAINISLPPDEPPDLQSIVLDMSSDRSLFRVRVRSSAEIRITPLGTHRMIIFTVRRVAPTPEEFEAGGLSSLIRETEHVRTALPSIAEITTPAETPGAITRSDLDSNGRWQYQSFVPTDDDEVVVRLIDPLGRISEQKALLIEPPLPIPPDLVDLRGVAVVFWLRVTFRSAAPVTQPPRGAYILELFNDDGLTPIRLDIARLHEIETGPQFGRFSRTPAPDPEGRYTYGIIRNMFSGLVSRVLVRLTDPDGLTSELRSAV